MGATAAHDEPDAESTAADEPDAELSAAAAMAVIAEQRESSKMLEVDGRLLYGAWGVAWVVGYGLLALRYAPEPVITWNEGLVYTLFGLLLTAAMVINIVHLVRRTRGKAGESARVGTLFGIAIAAGFTCMGMLNGALAAIAVPSDVLGLLSCSLSCLILGLVYLGGAMAWSHGSLGWLVPVLLIATAVVAAYAGVHWCYAVTAIGGGGSLLLGAALDSLQMNRGRVRQGDPATERSR